MLLRIVSVAFFSTLVLCVPSSSKTQSSLLDSEVDPQDVQKHPNLGLLPDNCGIMNNDKLLAGNRTMLYELPWMVPLSYHRKDKNILSCVGTLINERYLLTAAQCVTNLRGNTLNGAILGEYDLTTDPDCENYDDEKICGDKVMNVTIEEVIAHSEYIGGVSRQFVNNIALIRLTQPVDLTLESVGPICLPVTPELQRQSLAGQHHGEIAGWDLGNKPQLPVLSKFFVPIISNEECQEAYSRLKANISITSKHLCIRSSNFKGDLGGPLLLSGEYKMEGYRHIQRGIASFGPRNRETDIPEVYTRVAYYVKWILDNIRS